VTDVLAVAAGKFGYPIALDVLVVAGNGSLHEPRVPAGWAETEQLVIPGGGIFGPEPALTEQACYSVQIVDDDGIIERVSAFQEFKTHWSADKAARAWAKAERRLPFLFK
jgi:hypothetical protein